jgi:hypothetical protein
MGGEKGMAKNLSKFISLAASLQSSLGLSLLRISFGGWWEILI